MLAGVFDKFLDLQISLDHWGEVILFYLERLNPAGRPIRLTELSQRADRLWV